MPIENKGAGALPVGPDGNPIQVASSFQNRDATATPIESPKSVTNATVITIVVPDNAVAMHVHATNNALRFGDNIDLTGGDVADKGYEIILAGTKDIIGCAGMANIFFLGHTDTVIMTFRFEMLVEKT